jgi:beta-glucosidase
MTREEKLGLLPTRQAAVEHLGIGEYHIGGEGAHGVVDRDGNTAEATTVYPIPFGLACAWDKELMRLIGNAIADEARAMYELSGKKGWLTLWFPTIDPERDMRWGRTEEAYGEDPLLAGHLAAALIRGAHGDDPYYIKLSPAPKHFYANNNERDRSFSDSVMPERDKREYYLRAFRYAFTEGKALSLMTAYNKINGVPATVNPELLTVVKGEWGCEGFFVCDGGAFGQVANEHRHTPSHAHTMAAALAAGMDCFTDKAETVIEAARQALDMGLITEESIDRALFNILRVRARLGHFDARCPYKGDKARLCHPEHAALSLRAAEESIVLLQNNGLLPLKNPDNIAVIGELAGLHYPDWYSGSPPYYVTILAGARERFGEANVRYANMRSKVALRLGGGWVRVDGRGDVRTDGTGENRAEFWEIDWGYGAKSYQNAATGLYLRVDFEGVCSCLSERVGGWFVYELFWEDNGQLLALNKAPLYLDENGRIMSAVPLSQDQRTPQEGRKADAPSLTLEKETLFCGREHALELARGSDTTLLVMGNHPLICGRECYDRPGITFPPSHADLPAAFLRACPRLALVLAAGYPFALERGYEDIPAIIFAPPGAQGAGTAAARALAGDYSPAGRLPMTWLPPDAALPDIMDYRIIDAGRTYMYYRGKAQFPFGHGLSYSSFDYSGLIIDGEEVSFTLKNIGKTRSDETPQLYFAALRSAVPRPRLQLADFTRLTLDPGRSARVTLRLPASELAYYNEGEGVFTAEAGEYKVMVGASCEDIRLSALITVKEGE